MLIRHPVQERYFVKVFLAIFLIATFYSGPLLAQDIHSSPSFSPTEIHFDLPAQRLDKALLEYAVQSEVSLISDVEALAAFRSSPLYGNYSAEQGLKLILSGSPFGYRYSAMRKSIVLYRLASFRPRVPNLDNFFDKINLEEELLVTASGLNKPLRTAPAIATVITADEIKLLGIRDVEEALQNVPGLHVSLSALDRVDPVYSIRGIHTAFNPHVLLLINSVPVQYSLVGSRPAGLQVSLNSIEKIEVVRGPGSAIYGADAYSGVINIITKEVATGSIAEVGGEVGSFGSKRVWIHGEHRKDKWNFLFDSAYQKTEGDKGRLVDSDLQTKLDEIVGTNASTAPAYLSTRKEIIDLHLTVSRQNWRMNYWFWKSEDVGVGAGGAQALDLEGHDDSRLDLVDLRYSGGAFYNNWEYAVKLSHFNYDLKANFNLLPPGTIVPIGEDGNVNFMESVGLVEFPDGLIGNPGAKMKDSQFEVVPVYQRDGSHRLRIAVGARYQQIAVNEQKNFGPGVIDGYQPVVDGQLTDVTDTSHAFADNLSRRITYFSLQSEWSFLQEWELTAGVRYDDYSDFGNTVNPRLALVWDKSERLTTKFLYGSAFRAPSFGELSYKNNPVAVGNTDLDPEVIDTYELAATLRLSETLRTTLNLFFYKAQDLIEFVPDGAIESSNTAKNTRDQNGKGFEWEFLWRPSRAVRVNGEYSWSRATDSDTGRNIVDAPTRQSSLGSSWEIAQNLFVHMDAYWVGGRHRRVTDTRPEIDDYMLTNFSLSKKNMFDRMDLSFKIKNITNDKTYEPSSGSIEGDYPLEGRGLWFELSYRL
ncbi:MAG: TonB-dependent receptor [Agarilytica sp.]